MKKLIIAVGTMFIVGCATIVNDPNIPLTVSFSDGSAGKCTFKNKRGTWSSEIPTTNVLIRRSDDALNYDCSTKDGRQAEGSIKSEMEGGKMAASVIFWVKNGAVKFLLKKCMKCSLVCHQNRV